MTTGIESATAEDEHRKYVRSLTFLELLDFYDSWADALLVSARLRHILLANYKVFQFATVGEYLDAGEAASSRLMRIPNFSKKAERDWHNLVDEVRGYECRYHKYRPLFWSRKNKDCGDE